MVDGGAQRGRAAGAGGTFRTGIHGRPETTGCPLVRGGRGHGAAIGEVTHDEHVSNCMVPGEVTGSIQTDRALEEPEADERIAVVGNPIGAEVHVLLTTHQVV